MFREGTGTGNAAADGVPEGHVGELHLRLVVLGPQELADDGLGQDVHREARLQVPVFRDTFFFKQKNGRGFVEDMDVALVGRQVAFAVRSTWQRMRLQKDLALDS